MLACRDSIRKPLLLRRQTFGELGKRAHNNDANDTVSISVVHIIKTHQRTTHYICFFFCFFFLTY